VIGDEEHLGRIRAYIAENPVRWHLDREKPDREGEDALWVKLFSRGRALRWAPPHSEENRDQSRGHS
jgi:hypothetical protein